MADPLLPGWARCKLRLCDAPVMLPLKNDCQWKEHTLTRNCHSLSCPLCVIVKVQMWMVLTPTTSNIFFELIKK
jgi:hypothetical protein